MVHMANLLSVDVDQFIIKTLNINCNSYRQNNEINIFRRIPRSIFGTYKFYLPREIYNIISLEKLQIILTSDIKKEIINLRNLQIIYISSMNKLHTNFIKMNSIKEYWLMNIGISRSNLVTNRINPYFDKELELFINENT